MQALGAGVSIRQAASSVGMCAITAGRIAKLHGFRPQRHYAATPLYEATANILRTAEACPLPDDAALALSLATEISQCRAAEFLGPCYEAVLAGHSSGVAGDRLRDLARQYVARMWRETRTWAESIDDMKDRTNWEPSRQLAARERLMEVGYGKEED
jgi:hypothetical protein